MTKTIKRTAALLVACALLLCCVCAGAEEPPVSEQTVPVPAEESDSWRLYNDMTVDPILLRSLLVRICPNRFVRYRVEQAGILLNAFEPALTVSADGVQLDVSFNGENVLAIGGTRTDEGVAIASTLFPSYVISISTEKLMEIVSEIAPMTAKPSLGTKDGSAGAAPPSEADPDEALPIEEMSQYVSVSEPERGEFDVDGDHYDVKRTFSLDCDGLVGLWNTLVDWVFGNKGIAALMLIAQKADLKLDAAQVKAMVPTDSLPRFVATYYSSTITPDRYISAVASTNDGSKVYGEALFQSTEDVVTASLNLPPLNVSVGFDLDRTEGLRARLDIRGEEPLVQATFSTAEGTTGRLDIDLLGNHLGSDLALTPYDASGDGLRFVASLYYTDKTIPLFREEFAIQPHSALTLDFTGAKKTVVPITSLFNVGSGRLVGLAMDIVFNGSKQLLDATSNILAQLSEPDMVVRPAV